MNIVLIAIDTLRADHLSCYGYHRPTSPSIDQLAGESTVFANCFSQTSHTMPSYTTLLTGLSPVSHGIVGTIWCQPNENCHVLDDNIPTLAEVLQREGYLTCAVDNLHAMDCNPKWFPRGFEHYIKLTRTTGILEEAELEGKSYLQREAVCAVLAEELNRRAIPWLQQNTDEKFFMFLHYWDAHQPYNQPEPYRTMYSGERNKPKISQTTAGEQFIQGWGRVKEIGEEQRQNIDLYDGEVSYVDKHVSDILEALKKLGIYENTMIVLTADHGETMAEHHSYFNHREVYDAVVHVPLMIKMPRGSLTNAHATSEALVQNADIMPTILEAVGTKFNRPPAARGSGRDDGRSLLPVMQGEKTEHREYAFSTGSWIQDGALWKTVEIAVRTKNHKLIRRSDIARFVDAPVPAPYGHIGLIDFHNPKQFQDLPKEELLDLRDDPEELHDRSSQESDEKTDLKHQLDEWTSSEVFLKA